MKYGKEWKLWIATNNLQNTNYILSYTKWKKIIHYRPKDILESWQTVLYNDCKEVDKYLFSNNLINNFTKHFTNSLMNYLCINKNNSNNDNNKEKDCLVLNSSLRLSLCEWNSKTLYKICKKLQKQLHLPAMLWYSNVLSTHVFNFTGSAKKSYLNHKINPDNTECPICFYKYNEIADYSINKTNKNTDINYIGYKYNWIFLKCGHSMCMNCANSLWKMNDIRSNIYNKLANVNNSVVCPICRFHGPCHPSYAILLR